MQRDESFQDYMLGFAAGLKGGNGHALQATSPRAWRVGYDAGRSVREEAESSTSVGYIGMQSISLDCRDLLA